MKPVNMTASRLGCRRAGESAEELVEAEEEAVEAERRLMPGLSRGGVSAGLFLLPRPVKRPAGAMDLESQAGFSASASTPGSFTAAWPLLPLFAG
jgi:hypothetical protein